MMGRQAAFMGAFFGALMANPLRPGQAFGLAVDAWKEFDFATLFAGVGEEAAQDEEDRAGSQRRPTTEHNTHIQNLTIEQRFEGDVSPDRIAFGVFEELDRIRSRRAVLRPSQAF